MRISLITVWLHPVMQSYSHTTSPQPPHHTHTHTTLVTEQDSGANADQKAAVDSNTWGLIAGFLRTSNDVFIQCVIKELSQEFSFTLF